MHLQAVELKRHGVHHLHVVAGWAGFGLAAKDRWNQLK